MAFEIDGYIKTLKYEAFCFGPNTIFGQLALISDPHMNFQKSLNGLKNHKLHHSAVREDV